MKFEKGNSEKNVRLASLQLSTNTEFPHKFSFKLRNDFAYI